MKRTIIKGMIAAIVALAAAAAIGATTANATTVRPDGDMISN